MPTGMKSSWTTSWMLFADRFLQALAHAYMCNSIRLLGEDLVGCSLASSRANKIYSADGWIVFQRNLVVDLRCVNLLAQCADVGGFRRRVSAQVREWLERRVVCILSSDNVHFLKSENVSLSQKRPIVVIAFEQRMNL